MTNIVFARLFKDSRFVSEPEAGFDASIKNTCSGSYLFGSAVKAADTHVLYNAIKKLCGSEITGIVIYYNGDTRQNTLDVMRDAFGFISKASNISIRLVYEEKKDNGSYPKAEDFFA